MTFDEDAGLSLALFGTFVEDLTTLMAGQTRYPVVFGLAGGAAVTLLGSRQSAFTMRMPGSGAETLHVPIALIGAHIDEDEPKFTSVEFNCTHLVDWLDPPAHSFFLGGSGRISWRAQYDQPAPLDIYRGDSTLMQVAVVGTLSPMGHSFSASVDSVIRIYPRQEKTISELVGDYVLPLRDLITFGTAIPSPIRTIDVGRMDIVRDVQGTYFAQDIGVVAQFTQPRHDVRHEESIQPIFQMFGPGDVPGGTAGALSGWLDTYATSREAIDLFMGEMHQPTYWFPARVANVIKALEAYDRLNGGDAPSAGAQERIDRILAAVTKTDAAWLKLRLRAESSLRARLRRLLRRAKPVIEPLLGKERTMLDAFTDLRNADAHPGDQRRVIERSGLRMRRAMLWARWTLVANLLLDLGMSPEGAAHALLERQVFAGAIREMNNLNTQVAAPPSDSGSAPPQQPESPRGEASS